MRILFTIDELGLEGLGVTLVSLLNKCSKKESLQFIFLYANLSNKHIANIRRLLHEFSIEDSQIDFHYFDDKKMFGHLPSLYGSWVVYARLLVPRLFKEGKILCLDTDLIINLDVNLFFEQKIEDTYLATVKERSFGETLEKDFLVDKLKCDRHLEYFNMGVSLFNLSKWNQDNLIIELEKFIEKHKPTFRIVDQTIFNGFFRGDYYRLEDKFNTQVPPSVKLNSTYDNRIIHLMGSPKPWDITGRYISTSAKEWYAVDVPIFWRKEYNKLSIAKLKRTWNIKNSILYNAYLRAKNELKELLTKSSSTEELRKEEKTFLDESINHHSEL